MLELVEGPTLAERLAQGPLTLAQALGIAKQIAEALEAAHEKGIVHRDLKPANIVLQDAPGGSGSASGAVRAKVLDFGLAKMTAVGPEADQRPPDSVDGTEDGRLLGSPAYMSPEQARGERVDKRTDVWGFGCVLFEMLTGRVAFEGKTVPETLAAVLEHRPEWSALPATTPETIRRLVRRCLEKDPAHRLRDIGDARLEIDEVLSPPTLPRAVTVQPSASRLRMWLVIASLAAIAAIAAAGWYRWRSTTDNPAAPPSQLTRLTFDEGLQTDPTLEPHGRFVAYSSNKAGNFDIYTQPVAGGGNAVQVTKHPAHDWQPDWSIQDQLVFRSERDGGGLYVVAQTGGHERQIANFGYQPRWSPDGNRILFKCSAPGVFVCTVGLRGGSPRECKACGPVQGFGWFLDSRHVSILRSEPSPQHRGVPD